MEKRTAVNQIVESPLSVDIPATDIASYVFSSGTEATRRVPQYFDAANPTRNFSLAEAKVCVKRFAKGLQDNGLRRGDRVLLFSENQLFFPVVLWSVSAAGCIFTAASPAATVSELEYQLRDSGAKILLTSQEGAGIAQKAAANVGLAPSQVYLFCDPDHNPGSAQIRKWSEIWSSPTETRSWTWQTIRTPDEAKSTTAVINYSSGTTGLPKGVEITHYNLVSNSEQVIYKRNREANTPSGRTRNLRLQDSGERWMAPLPMYHAFGQAYAAMSAARLGAKVFIMTKFDIPSYLLYLDIYRITFMTTVPTILTMLIKQKNPERFNLKAIEVVTSGSSPLDAELASSVSNTFLRSTTQVKQGWGMTETTCSVTGFSPDDQDDGRSIGWLNPNCCAKIVPVEDENFASAAPTQLTVGEIWVAGPNIMKGYWRKPEATAETMVNEDGYRWLRTGDIGYIDHRGCLYIVDRLKELIKVKGLQVAPAELQLALLSHPAVMDAAVVGAKINGNEYPRAFIVRKDQSAVTSEGLFDFVKQRFASHKWLTGGVYFVDSIPRTPSGKVVKRALPDLEVEVRAKL